MPRLNSCQYLRLFKAHVEPSNSLESIPSWEANSRPSAQEFPNLLWNPKVHYRVCERPPLGLSRARWIQSIPSHPPHFSRISWILSSQPRLGLPSGLFILRYFSCNCCRWTGSIGDSLHPMCQNSCRLFQRSRPSSRLCVTFRNNFFFRWGVVSPTPIGCLRVFIQYIRS
jgi:hypothetical protein